MTNAPLDKSDVLFDDFVEPHGLAPTQEPPVSNATMSPTDLLAWLRAQGGRLDGVDARSMDGMGTGLVALEPKAVGDPILFVPRALWVTRKTVHSPWSALVHGVPEDHRAHSMSRLGLLMALERSQGGSWFQPYLDALGEPTVPYRLGAQERAAVQGLTLGPWIDEQTTAFHAEAHALGAWLSAHHPEAPALSSSTWEWALGHVMQRSFSVDHEGEEVWVLVPGMDLCNHADEPNARYFAEEDGWYLEAARPVAPGEQITIRYGRAKTSADLLLYYGFVTPDNPNDRLHLELVLAPEDPDRAAKEAAVEMLGLSTDTLVDGTGALPSVFLHAAVLYGLDTTAFRAEQPDVANPARAVRALANVRAAVEGALAAFPTRLAEDRALQASRTGSGWLPSILQYRINAKQCHQRVLAGLDARIAEIEREGWRPAEVVPEDPDGRHGIAHVRVVCRGG